MSEFPAGFNGRSTVEDVFSGIGKEALTVVGMLSIIGVSTVNPNGEGLAYGIGVQSTGLGIYGRQSKTNIFTRHGLQRVGVLSLTSEIIPDTLSPLPVAISGYRGAEFDGDYELLG
jgi:hypothetical protein